MERREAKTLSSRSLRHEERLHGSPRRRRHYTEMERSKGSCEGGVITYYHDFPGNDRGCCMEIKIAGSLNKYGFDQADKVIEPRGGISPTILAHLQGQMGHQIQVIEHDEIRESDKGKD